MPVQKLKETASLLRWALSIVHAGGHPGHVARCTRPFCMKATETIQEMNLEIMEGEARPAYLRETP